MKFVDGIPVWGAPIDEGALSQIKECARTAVHVALMADHHKGYSVPIGGVLAYHDQISPSGVGFDIACGNKAVLTDADAGDVQRNIVSIMDDVWRRVSFGIGRKNNVEVEHELFEDDPAWLIPEVSRHKSMARSQLGTVGSGNHYVDIFRDEQNRIWIGVHFGSRGLGHKIATHFLESAGASDNMDAPPCLINANSYLGEDYLTAMELAGRYAYAGRDWVCQEVANILGANILDEVHNHHNFAWRETHFGEKLWVIRKGATPAFPGQKGFVGGTMGEASVILEGVASSDGPEALYSTVHGAGRVMSRTAAKGKTKIRKVWQCGMRGCGMTIPIKDGKMGADGSNPRCSCGGKMHRRTATEIISPGRISVSDLKQWLDKANVELRGGGLDEAPQAYKRLNEVLTYHQNSVKILHTLTPLGVCMAGADEFDPYKD